MSLMMIEVLWRTHERENVMLGSRGWVLSGLETEVGSQGVTGRERSHECLS